MFKKSTAIRICMGAFVIISLALLLSGCSVTVGDTELSGINIIWAPFVFLWDWLWNSFTPSFWTFVDLIWELPGEVVWLAAIIVYALGAVLYVCLAAIIVILDIIIAIITGIVWFILSVLNGFFHFV